MKSTAVALMFGFFSKRAARLLTELTGRGGTESALSRVIDSGTKAAAGCFGEERISPTMVKKDATKKIATCISLRKHWHIMI